MLVVAQLLHLIVFTPLALAWVELDPALIPLVPAKLPVLSLGPPSFLPPNLLESIASTTPPNSTVIRRQDDPRTVVYRNGAEAGYQDTSTGQTVIPHDLSTLTPFGASSPSGATSNPIISDVQQSLPADGTSTTVQQGPSMQGGDHSQSPGLTRRHSEPDSTYLSLGVIHRSIKVDGQSFSTCGPGSQAVFGVDANNKVASVSFFWKEAKKSGQTCETLSVHEISKRIKNTLQAKHAKAGLPLKVYFIEACFYDSGAQFIQPVYRVLSVPYDHKTNQTLAGGNLDYIPIGKEAFEPIDEPAVTEDGEDDEVPHEPQSDTKPAEDRVVARSMSSSFRLARQNPRRNQPTVTVGIYVVRNDIIDFVEDAWNFWLGLKDSPIINFVKKQYKYAQSWMFGSSANPYVNSVDLALVKTHGNFHAFTTDNSRTDVDYVRIPEDIIPGGYGKLTNGGKGCLSYLIIDAGEVMPTTPDFQAIGVPAEEIEQRVKGPWEPVFKGGVRAIMSWRTSPLQSDNVVKRWAESVAASNSPVVDAWLYAAQVDPAYTGGPTYTGRGTGKEGWPLGKAAAMYRCDRPSDRVTDLDKLDETTCVSVRYWT